MSERLRRFLIDVASDEARAEHFVREALDESELTADERAAILSRDPNRVRLALGTERQIPTIRILSWFKKKAKKKRKSKRKSKSKTKGARYSARKRTRGTSRKRSRRAAPRRQR